MKTLLSLLITLSLFVVACDSSDDTSTTTGGTPAGSQAGTPAGSEGGTPAGSEGGTPAGAQGGTPAGAQGGTPAGAQGGTPAGAQGGTPAGAQGGTPAGAQGGTPAGSEGGTTAGTPAGSTPMTRPEIILSLTPDVVAGEASYVNCIACHGADAKGRTTSMRLSGSDLTQEIADKMNFVNTVLNGTSGMIPYDYLEDQEIANIIGYVESLATR